MCWTGAATADTPAVEEVSQEATESSTLAAGQEEASAESAGPAPTLADIADHVVESNTGAETLLATASHTPGALAGAADEDLATLEQELNSDAAATDVAGGTSSEAQAGASAGVTDEQQISRAPEGDDESASSFQSAVEDVEAPVQSNEQEKDEPSEKDKDESSEKDKDESSEKDKDESSEKDKDESSEMDRDEASEKDKDKASEKDKEESEEKDREEQTLASLAATVVSSGGASEGGIANEEESGDAALVDNTATRGQVSAEGDDVQPSSAEPERTTAVEEQPSPVLSSDTVQPVIPRVEDKERSQTGPSPRPAQGKILMINLCSRSYHLNRCFIRAMLVWM